MMPADRATLGPMPMPVHLPNVALLHASQAVEQAFWVNSTSGYEAVADHLSTQSLVGIDTEFVRERTFYPSPGLIQLSDGHSIWLIDVVTLEDHEPLKALINQPTTTKILHSVGEDLEILSLLTESYPANLFDTQVAAAFLGFPAQIRYEHLVEQVFGDTLPGGQARSNWCQRPLSGALLEYAAQDVIYLPQLAETLSEALDRLDRLDWVQEDCARLVKQRRAAPKQPAIVRVKGAGRLSVIAMAYAANLADWRDKEAKSRNLPRSFIIKDELLLELATQAERMGTVRAVSQCKNALRKFSEACQVVLENTDPSGFEVPTELLALSPEQRQKLKAWQTKVGELATELNIEPSVIASKRELTRLLKGESPDWLTGWRGPMIQHQLGLGAI